MAKNKTTKKPHNKQNQKTNDELEKRCNSYDKQCYYQLIYEEFLEIEKKNTNILREMSQGHGHLPERVIRQK